MKRMTAAQLRVVVALNFVIIALLCGLLFLNPFSQPLPVDGEIAEHNRIRTGSISMNPALRWELSIGGSKEDEAVAAFLDGNNIIVFGNTASSDLDFDYAGTFVAFVDRHGVTRGFNMLSHDRLKGVIVAEGGYLLALQGENHPYLLLVDASGEIVKKLDDFLLLDEEIVELKSYSNGYFLLTAPQNNLTATKKLRCIYFDSGLNYTVSILADSTYSLSLVESVVISGKVVAICNGSSTFSTQPVIVEFVTGGSPKIHVVSEASGKVYGFAASSDGFLLLSENSVCSLLTIGYDFAYKSKVVISQSPPKKLLAFNGNYLAFCDGAVFLIDIKGAVISTFPEFLIKSYKKLSEVILAAADGASFCIYGDSTVLYRAPIGEGENPLLLADTSDIFCIYEYSGDITITALRVSVF